MKSYLDLFGRDKVFTIIYDDFKIDLRKLYRETLHFLGVNENFKPKIQIINPIMDARSKILKNFLKNPPQAVRLLSKAFLSRSRRENISRGLRQFNTLLRPRQRMDPELRRRLQAKFIPEVEQLSKLLERDLTHWCKG